jgi:hypothetical protein
MIQVNINLNPTQNEILKQISDNIPKRKCLIAYVGKNGDHCSFSADYPLTKKP